MEQNMEALKRANEIRIPRAKVKREVRAGKRSVADVLNPGGRVSVIVRTMPIAELVRSQDRWGVIRTRKFLGRLGIRESRRIGDLTARERRLVVRALSGEEVPEALVA